LTPEQQGRLEKLPVGFTQTGGLTPYRKNVGRKIIKTFMSIGWFAPLYMHTPFEASSTTISDANEIAKHYELISPQYLFNLNPPQHARWPYSSPMRIFRAIMLGQIPVITKRFHDHFIEDVAMQWDSKRDTALEWATYRLRDRHELLANYLISLKKYDELAQMSNMPFVNAIAALADDVQLATVPLRFAASN
jgi:hypothetical protein